MAEVICHFRLLRVLNIHDTYLIGSGIPHEIGKLIHLRNLELRNCKFPEAERTISLPTSIGNLKSLYVLDLYHLPSRTIPDVLWKLECLRHLTVDLNDVINLRLETLKQLQTLKWVRAKDLIKDNAVLKLTNLRDLCIFFTRREEAEVVLGSPIFNSGHLRYLKMISSSYIGSFANLEPLFACHNLTKLLLGGAIAEEENQDNLKFLPGSLAKLSLEFSQLKKDPMGILEKLPTLRILKLGREAYEGSEMSCSTNGFPKLETLTLMSLQKLKEWRVEEGAMPCLKTLHLRDLWKLKMIPDGVKFLSTLTNLKLDMPPDFMRRVQVVNGVEGEDYEKVRHIPLCDRLVRSSEHYQGELCFNTFP